MIHSFLSGGDFSWVLFLASAWLIRRMVTKRSHRAPAGDTTRET